VPGVPVKGHWPSDPGHHDPSHDHHMEHFDEAMKDALNQWPGGTDAEADAAHPVTLEARVSTNPGGVREYIVKIG
jgi:hypothetical protein